MKNNKRISLSFVKKRGNNLDKLSPRRLAKYEDSLEVLRLMRNNNITLTKASRVVQISPSTVKRNLGKVFAKEKQKNHCKEKR